MKWITFSFYKSYYYFIIFWIVSILISLFKKIYENINQESQKSIQITNSIMYQIDQIIGNLVAGFLVLYTYLTTDSLIINETENNSDHKNDKLINNEPSKKMHRCSLILIVSVIYFINASATTIYSLYLNKLKDGEVVWLISVTISSRIFFSHYLLKINLYKHHYVSIISFLIGSLFLGIFAIYADNFEFENIFYIFLVIFRNILLGLQDVLNKILFTKKYLLPHSLMFYIGLFNSAMIISFVLILKFSGIELIFPKDFLTYLLCIFSIFTFFFYDFVIFKVNYIFTPQHVSFLNTVYYMFILIFYRISNNFSLVIFICEIIVWIFISFSTLIFSEMIIINKWGLNENTKKGLLIKEQQEFEDDENRISELMNDQKDKDKENKKIPEEKNNYTN